MKILKHTQFLFFLFIAFTSLGQNLQFTKQLSADKANVCHGSNLVYSTEVQNATYYAFLLNNSDTGLWEKIAEGTISTARIALEHTLYNLSESPSIRVLISDGAESLYSNSHTVNVHQPTFDFHPLNSIQCNGKDVEFRVSSSNAGQFQWQGSTDGGSNFTDLSVSTKFKNVSTPNLLIDGITSVHHGQVFRCVITDAFGCQNYSDPATLNVNRLSTAISPTTATQFCEGDTAEFYAQDIQGDSVSFQWQLRRSGESTYSDLSEDSRFTDVQSKVLTVNGLVPQDNNYRLQVTFKNALQNASGQMDSATCTLQSVRTNYIINPRPTKPAPLDTVSKCGPSVFNFQSVQPYIWYTDSLASPVSMNALTFQTTQLTETTTFFYTLKDTKGCESHKQSVVAQIHTVPSQSFNTFDAICPNTTTLPIGITSSTGEPIEVHIRSPDFPYLNHIPLAESMATALLQNNKPSGTFPIALFTKNQHCFSDTISQNLIVLNPTKILNHPQNAGVCVGESLTLNTDYQADNPINFKWLKNGEPIIDQNQATLNIPSILDSDSGHYQLVVSGFCGSDTSNAAIVSVSPAIEIQEQPQNASVCSNTNAIFKVKATGSSQLNYQWLINDAPVGGNTDSLELERVDLSQNNAKIKCLIKSNCSNPLYTEEVLLTVNALPLPPTIADTLKICTNDETLDLASIISGEHTLNWYNHKEEKLTSSLVNLNQNRSYFVSHTDQNACESSQTAFTIELAPSFSILVESNTAKLCTSGNFNTSGSLMVFPNQTSSTETQYELWLDDHLLTSNTNGSFDFNATGLYTVKAWRGFCSSIDSLRISSVGQDLINAPSTQNMEICEGTNLTLTAESEYQHGNYFWWMDAERNSGLFMGKEFPASDLHSDTTFYVSYGREVENVFCESPRSSFKVTLKEKPNLEVEVISGVNCQNIASLRVSSSAQTPTFNLNDSITSSTGLFSDLSAGSYTVSVTDASRCKKDTTITIQKPLQPIITQQIADIRVCQGNIANFSFLGNNYDTVIWFKKLPSESEYSPIEGENANTLRVSNSGSTLNPHLTKYKATLYKGDCQISTNEVSLLINSIVGNSPSHSVCEKDSLSLNLENYIVTGDISSYQWQFRPGTSGSFENLENQNSSTLLLLSTTVDKSGYYRNRIVFDNGNGKTCVMNTSTNGIRVSVNPLPQPRIIGADSVCSGQSITLSAENCNGSLLWSDGSTGIQNTVSPNISTEYFVICNQAGCINSSDTVSVILKTENAPKPNISANKTELCYGESLSIHAENCPGFIRWSNGLSGNTMTLIAESNLSLSAVCITEDCQSPNSDTLKITVSPQLLAGSIAENSGIYCAGYNPPNIASLLNPNTPNIQWQSSVDCINWQNIDGAVSETYNPDAIQQSTCYRRMVWNKCDTLYSNSVTIEITPDPILSIQADKDTVCNNENAMLTSERIGGTGNCPVQWQINKVSSSHSNPNWKDLATGETLEYGLASSLSDSTFHFRARVTCDGNSCNLATSNVLIILFKATPLLITNLADTTICAGTSLSFTANCTNGDLLWSNGSTNPLFTLKPTIDTELSVTCSNHCSKIQKSISIQVTEGISPPINETLDSVFAPASLIFKALGTNLKWYLSENTSTALDSSPVINSPGSYAFWVSQTIESCESPRLKISASLFENIRIITQTSEMVNCYGNVSNLIVTAVGSGDLYYKWQRKRPDETDFSDIIPNNYLSRETTASLRIGSTGNLESPTGTLFRCIVSDNFSQFTSAEIPITANRIQGNLPNQNLCLDQTLTLNLQNSHSITGNALVVQWQHRRGTGDEWIALSDSGNVKGSNTLQLSVSKLPELEQIQYRCSITFSSNAGSCIETSDLMTLKVGKFPDKPEGLEQEICQTDKVQKFEITPPNNHKIIWFRLNDDAPLRTQPTLSSDVSGVHNLEYLVESNLGCKSPKAIARLTVNPSPPTPVNTTPAVYNESESLTFSAIGENLKWYRTKTLKAYEDYAPTFNSTGKKSYYVTQTDAKGCESERLQIQSQILEVFGISTQPVNQSNCDGNTVTFSVRTSGGTNISYQWQIESQGVFLDLPGQIFRDLKIEDSGTSPYIDGAKFRCIVSYEEKEIISNTAELKVNYLKSHLPEINLCEGEKLSFERYADSLSGIVNKMEWQRRIGSTYSTVFESEHLTDHFVPDSNTSGSYRFRVTFHNLGGGSCVRNSNIVRFNQHPLPQLTGLDSLTICEGDNIKTLIAKLPPLSRILNADSSETDLLAAVKPNSTFIVSVSNDFGCSSDFKIFKPISLSVPEPERPDSLLSLCRFAEFTEYKIQNSITEWYLTEDTPIFTENQLSIETHEPGIYNLFYRLRGKNGCASPKHKMAINVSSCYFEGNIDTCFSTIHAAIDRNEWTYFYKDNGEIFGAIHPNGSNMGRVEMRLTNTPDSTYRDLKNNQFYPRSWITNTSRTLTTSYRMRLYLSKDEIRAFKKSISDSVTVLHKNLVFQNCEWSADSTLFWMIGQGTWAESDHSDYFYTEFETAKTGQFLLWSDLIPEGTLHVKLNQNQVPELRIESYKKLPIGNYVINKSESGLEWSVIKKGSFKNETIQDLRPYLYKTRYQLLYDFENGIKAMLDTKEIEIPETFSQCTVFNNPITENRRIAVYFPEVDKNKIFLTDLLGREVELKQVSQNSDRFEISPTLPLAKGTYLLKMTNAQNSTCMKKILVL